MNVQCCVDGCPHVSGIFAESQGITFHELPNHNITLRMAWLKALDKYPVLFHQEEYFVCSLHFGVTDFMFRKGKCILKPTAVPVLNRIQEASRISNHIIETVETTNSRLNTLQICRICLTSNMKLLSIAKYKLETAYEELTGVCLDEDILPKYLCVECAQRLINCSRFRQKSFEGYLSLIGLEDGEIPLNSIKYLNKQRQAIRNLTPCLVMKSFETNHCDYIFEEETLDDKEQIAKELTGANENEDVLDNNVMEINPELNLIDVKDNAVNFCEDDKYIFIEIEGEAAKVDINECTRTNVNDDDDVLLNTMKINEIDKEKENNCSNKPEEKTQKKTIKKVGYLKNFTITTLTNEEQIRYYTSRKERDFYEKSSFKCTLCYRGYSDKHGYDIHMKRHSDGFGKYECSVCHLRYESESAVKIHSMRVHLKKFSCNLCSRVYATEGSAQRHDHWHRGTKFKCPHCDRELPTQSAYMAHVRNKHASCVCELCGCSFLNELGIRYHKNLVHKLDSHEIPEDGPLCEECNIRFVSEEALKKHLSVSLKHKTHKKGASNSRRFGMLSKKPLKKPKPCEQCGLQLDTYYHYTAHFANVHKGVNRTHFAPTSSKQVMCDQCGRIFQCEVYLRRHYRIHTGNTPSKPGKLCKSKTPRLKQRKMFPCGLCERSFSSYHNMLRHTKYFHSDVRPFQCEVCDKSFKSDPEKRLHIDHVHHKKPWPKRKRGNRRPTGILPADSMEEQKTIQTQDSTTYSEPELKTEP